MTREEAIGYLKGADITVGREPKTKTAEALEMAIKVLEQETCYDAISRQEAIDAIEKTKAAMATDGEIYVAKINAEMNIQQLPPVSTEKTGHWIYKTVRGEEVPCCSRCGLDNGTYYEFNFCPECGANMVEPQESEDKE